jgi:hypothetical protein
VLLLLLMLVGLALLYRYGPDRDDPKWIWASPGAVVATALWLAGSALFAVYTANFGKYNETYGSLGVVVVVMLWLYISALSVLLGAEINSELERQTVKDTTEGGPQPMGRRRATAADSLGPTARSSTPTGDPAGRRAPTFRSCWTGAGVRISAAARVEQPDVGDVIDRRLVEVALHVDDDVRRVLAVHAHRAYRVELDNGEAAP